MPFLPPNQQCQSTEGTTWRRKAACIDMERNYVTVILSFRAGTGVLNKAEEVVDSGKGSPTAAMDAVVAGGVPGTEIALNSWQANGAIPVKTAYSPATSRRSAWGNEPPEDY